MTSFIIIEDNLAVRYLLEETVKRLGYELIAAVDNIASAMRYLKARKVPDFILLDIVLPGGAGTGIIEYVRTHHKDVRIVIITGVSEERLMSSVPPENYYAILHKPFTVEQLKKIINS